MWSCWIEKTLLPPYQTQNLWARGASRGPPVRQEGGKQACTEASALCREMRREPDSACLAAGLHVRVLLREGLTARRQFL